MALVLCTGVDKALLQSRQLILERAGHTVLSATDEKALITICQNAFLRCCGDRTGSFSEYEAAYCLTRKTALPRNKNP